MPTPLAEALGLRIYAVREALRPSPRKELAQGRFAELLNERAEVLYAGHAEQPRFDQTRISGLELGKIGPSLADVTVIASVDPKRRGRVWLAWGDEADSTMVDPDLMPFDKARDSRRGTGKVAQPGRPTKKIGDGGTG